MQTQYEFIHFEKIVDSPKTSTWICVNNESGGTLGVVNYYPNWRQYCFFARSNTIFSAGCMQDIIKFMADLRQYELEGKK